MPGNSWRRPPAQPDPAGVRHALRREARLHQRRRDRRLRQAARRRRVQRHRPVDQAGQRQPLVRAGMTAADVLTFTRLAGDAVGATKMDRPEDVEPSPLTGKVYVALTNNTDRGAAGKARRRRGQPAQRNKHGHILELIEDRGDHTARDVHLVAADRLRRPDRPVDLLRRVRQDQGLADLLPGQRRLRRARQPVDLHRRQRAGQQRRPLRHRGRGPGAGSPQAVPDRAARRGDLRPVHHRRRPLGLRRGAAPGRDHRRVGGEAGVDWPDGDFAKPGVVVTWRLDGGPIGS